MPSLASALNFHRILPEFSAILKENKEISKVHEKNVQKQPKKHR